VRNNLFYNANSCGNSIGGYAPATKKGGPSNGGGSSYHDVFVNNTLYNNGTQPGSSKEGTPSGEFQIQNQVGSAQGNYLRKQRNLRICWLHPTLSHPICGSTATSPLNQAYPDSLKYPGPPATLNWNLYDSAAGYEEGTSILWADVSSYKSFSNYQATNLGGKMQTLSMRPQFVDLGASPPNVSTLPGFSGVAAGSTASRAALAGVIPMAIPQLHLWQHRLPGNPRKNGSKN
jgi:hypothetical protein